MTITPLEKLRAHLEQTLRGQQEAKVGLLLAFLAGEHAYLEGPPGCGKTLLAESFATGLGACRSFLRFHRDTKAWDLLGDAVLHRHRHADGERLRQELEPGDLLRAEVAVLDELSRAPGEALGLLGRILSERHLRGRALPLRSAIATGLAPESDAYLDPLEPAQLDRFAIQVRMTGLLVARDWSAARALLDGDIEAGDVAVLEEDERSALRQAVARLPIPDEVCDGLQRFAMLLAERARQDPQGLVSDRSFARAAPAVLRAHAFMRGATAVGPEDLRALRYMLARRVSPAVLAEFESLLEQALNESGQRDDGLATRQGQRAGTGGGAASRRVLTSAQGRRDLQSSRAGAALDPAHGVERILKTLEGRFERGRVQSDEDPAGSPRRYRSLRRLEELLDADPVEASEYVRGRWPGLPHTLARERRRASGRLAILRDVSASMEGRLSYWAGQVVAGLVRRGRRWRMRVGYLEFNHEAERYAVEGRFFHRHYRELLALAGSARAEGRTNYEAPLRCALDEFGGRVSRDRHIVFLTDGVPVLGDPEVRAERELAAKLGVKIHTVFLGLGEYPAILDVLARETGGGSFLARPSRSGLQVCDRAEVA